MISFVCGDAVRCKSNGAGCSGTFRRTEEEFIFDIEDRETLLLTVMIFYSHMKTLICQTATHRGTLSFISQTHLISVSLAPSLHLAFVLNLYVTL